VKPVLAIAIASCAGAALAAAPNPMPPEAFTAKTLANGLTVIVRRVPGPLTAASLWVRAGSADGPDGVAHALEHVLFKGGEGVPAGSVDAAAEAAGGQITANTYREAARFRSVFPAEGLETTLKALADLVRPPAVSEADWLAERGIMLEELARPETDAAVSVRNRANARLFSPSSPVAGTPAGLMRLTPADIRAFHKATYVPHRMTLVIVGDVREETALAAAERTLGALPGGASGPPGPRRSLPVTQRPPAAFEAVEDGHAELGVACLATGVEPAVMDVLARILRNRLSATLSGIADRVEVSYASGRAPVLTLMAIGPESARSRLAGALNDIVTASPDFSPAEVASAVWDLSWTWWLGKESPAVQADAVGLAAVQGRWQAATDYPDRLAVVTAKDLAGAAHRVFGEVPERPLP
jgi:zinc protease